MISRRRTATPLCTQCKEMPLVAAASFFFCFGTKMRTAPAPTWTTAGNERVSLTVVEVSRSHVVYINVTRSDEWRGTGYCGLGRAVASLGLSTQGAVDVDMIVSSLGAVNSDLILALYYAAQGDDGTRVYRERTARSRGNKARAGSSATITPLACEESFRIYFPSHQTVAESRGGTKVGKFNRSMETLDGMLRVLTRQNQSAGTICTQAKWWNAESFPRRLIRDCVSRRPGLLLHNKMMFVRQRETASGGALGRAWAYVGSANLSESAW